MADWNDQLRQTRERLGWSQHALARQAGLAPKTVVNYELGKGRATRDTLLKLSQALHLDRGQTNVLLDEAGFDPLPIGRVQVFEQRRLPFSLLQQEVDRYTWPCLVMSDAMEILLWNQPAVRVAEFDFAKQLPELPRRNLMRISAMEHFQKRVRNWDHVVEVMLALLKGDFDDPERYAAAMPYFGKLVDDLRTKPDYQEAFPRMMQLWLQTVPRQDVARTSFQALWQLGDGAALTFNCIVSSWNDFDATYAFDWQPADGATVEWLQQRAELATSDVARDAGDRGREPGASSEADNLPRLPDWHDVLRWAREKSGYSQATLARAVGITEDALYSYEHGRRTPSRPVALRLARAMLLDGATTNLILTGAGLPAVASAVARSVAGQPSGDPRFWPGRWEQRAQQTRELLPALIGAHPWPCMVLDEQCRVLDWNAAAERVLGSALAKRSTGDSLLQLLVSDVFRGRAVTYEEVIWALTPGALKDALAGEGLDQRSQPFQRLLTALRTEEPAILAELQRLWQAAPASVLSTRATYAFVWRHDDGSLLNFNGVVSLWSDYLWYWALDWHPADAATWRWLAGTG